tara:strand:+ start:653 stop:1231 length:579 start_codon:yes stop_codon:yes gene_type:complete
MRKYLQLILLIILISISFIYYKKYFYKEELVKTSITKNKDEISGEKQNNLIKNLKYEVKFDNNTEYTVLAELSEQVNENGNEFIKMKTVSGIFTNEKNVQLIIKSNNAVYNNLNYNTNFSNNVKIEYEDNIIYSENLDLDFTKNTIKIYNNVVYEGINGLVKTDNIEIDLISKNVEIFMSSPKDNVIVETKG